MTPSSQAAVLAVATFASVGCGVYALLASLQGRASEQAALRQLAEYGERDVRHERLLSPLAARIVVPLWKRATRMGHALTPTGTVARVRHKLVLAGKPRRDALDRFLARQALSVAAGVAAALLVILLTPLRGALRWIAVALIILVSALLPRARLDRSAERRQQAIRASLSNAIDLLTVSVEAGFGLDPALERVAADTSGPLAEELRRLQGDMRAGASRASAMRALVERTQLPELRSFVNTILQADALGIPIVPVLRAQSQELRVRWRQLTEERAQKAPVKMLLPMVFCIFPALFVVVVGPAMINIGSAFQ